ncbi:7995_t:CDS:1 [Funneliformis mosseae]|uniref:7995_t:CDS:1 n=1 Tax=Funneliformis mosseae TaxID=27381 RepID=A0A9N8WA68_FUNMO|nr:7995_t:CDS:1 [Funneliformis mosseae]
MTTTKTSIAKPMFLIKTTFDNTTTITPVMATASMASSHSSSAGSLYLPIQQKNKKHHRLQHKHLRKPQSFDTYLPTSTTTPSYGYYTRSASLSSSCSSTSSLDYNDFSTEDMMYGYGSSKSPNSTPSIQPCPRLRRGSSAVKLVRFAGAEANDDESSIVSSSSSSSADDWDPREIEEEDDEVFFVSQPRSFHLTFHKKSLTS